jgi:hypothetical protein
MSKPEWVHGIFGLPLSFPYGDDPSDQYWIKMGFIYTERQIK